MDLLPIGTVVLLKEAEKRLMIYGIKQVNVETEQIYDYIGCLYPEGYIGGDYNYLFNHEDIEKVDYIGFMDAEFQIFRAELSEKLNETNENQIIESIKRNIENDFN